MGRGAGAVARAGSRRRRDPVSGAAPGHQATGADGATTISMVARARARNKASPDRLRSEAVRRYYI